MEEQFDALRRTTRAGVMAWERWEQDHPFPCIPQEMGAGWDGLSLAPISFPAAFKSQLEHLKDGVVERVKEVVNTRYLSQKMCGLAK